MLEGKKASFVYSGPEKMEEILSVRAGRSKHPTPFSPWPGHKPRSALLFDSAHGCALRDKLRCLPGIGRDL